MERDEERETFPAFNPRWACAAPAHRGAIDMLMDEHFDDPYSQVAHRGGRACSEDDGATYNCVCGLDTWNSRSSQEGNHINPPNGSEGKLEVS